MDIRRTLAAHGGSRTIDAAETTNSPGDGRGDFDFLHGHWRVRNRRLRARLAACHDWEDVADLQLSGVPIEGEAGVGYVLGKGADIPPLMFNADELEALVMGTRFVRAFGGERLGTAANAALLKIDAMLPAGLRERGRRTRIFAPELDDRIEATGMIDRLHVAIETRHVLRLDYRACAAISDVDALPAYLQQRAVPSGTRAIPVAAIMDGRFVAAADVRHAQRSRSLQRQHRPRRTQARHQPQYLCIDVLAIRAARIDAPSHITTIRYPRPSPSLRRFRCGTPCLP